MTGDADTPWEPPWRGTEAEQLLGALERMRWTFRWKVDGLGRSGLTARLGTSPLTLGGLLKHLARAEDYHWGTKMLGEHPAPQWQQQPDVHDWEFAAAAADDPATLYREYDEAVEVARTRLAAALADGGLDQPVWVGREHGLDANLRRLVCDFVEEYGRHVGHADLLREAVDGRVGEDPPPGWVPVGAVEDGAVEEPLDGGRRGVRARDLRGSRLVHVDLSGSSVTDADLAGLHLRSVHLSDVDVRGGGGRGLRMRGVELAEAQIDGEIHSLRVNGVEVAGWVEEQLDARDPRRVLMRPTTPEGFVTAFATLDEAWAETVRRARGLDPALLYVEVDGEWSFVQTLRHLAFAADCWVGRMIEQQPDPWHPDGLPWDEAPPLPHRGWRRDLPLALDEAVALWQGRLDHAAEVAAGMTAERLAEQVTAPDGPGYPPAGASCTVAECLRVLLTENWEHRRFAERDLDRVTAG